MRAMKMMQAVVLAVAAVGSVWASPTNKFDLNNDGKVDGRDASQLMTMLQYLGPTGSMPAMPGAAEDLSGDGQLSLADWREFTRYASVVGAYPDALFDVAIQWGQPTGVNAADKFAIAQAVAAGRGGSYSMRFDFNADGRVDMKDWMAFVSHAQKAYPAVLLDADGNGAVNGRDLDRFAQMIDARSYDPAQDLNGDGVMNAADWRIVVQLANLVSQKAVFDVDGTSGVSQAVVSAADSRKIAVSLQGLSVGFQTSIRYDLNGDGVVQQADWGEWVRWATMVYKKPDMVLDVNGDGFVNSGDMMMVNSAIGQFPVQIQFDVNGDGVVNASDAALIAMRIVMGPAQLIAGDVNRDGCVNSADLAMVQSAQGAMSSMPLYDPDLDVAMNGYIGPDDLNVVSMNMGRCR
jgi:hypothetical protein